jgi:hypothetical protein
LVLLAQLAARDDDTDRVRVLLEELIVVAADTPRWWCTELTGAARAATAVGAFDLAERLIPERPVDMRRPELMRRTARAILGLATGDADDMVEPLTSLVTEWGSFGHRLESALCNQALAQVLDMVGDHDGATISRMAAADGLAGLGVPTTPWWTPGAGGQVRSVDVVGD